MVACLDKGVVACLYGGVVECLDEGVFAWLDEGVTEILDGGLLPCLDKNIKDDFDVDITQSLDDCFEYFLLGNPLEYILEGTLGGKCIFHHFYMNECGWYETFFQLLHDHEQIKPTTYQALHIMGVRGVAMRPTSTSTINIKNFSTIVAGLLKPKLVSSTITTTITCHTP